MKQSIYFVDAFTTTLYGGNPAAVCLLPEWIDEQTMRLIARENNLSETAFIVREEHQYRIRWFTPNTEVDLCGHATLASAYVLFEILGYKEKQIEFTSKSGLLKVKRENDLLQMDFPALPFSAIDLNSELSKAMNVQPAEMYQSTFDILCIFTDSDFVKNIQLDLNKIASLPHRGIILSAPGTDSDVYSRCFYPACNVSEDPVTGSAHCVIAPYWSSKLNKKELYCKQGGTRQGELWCKADNDRVIMSGRCQLYLTGEIVI